MLPARAAAWVPASQHLHVRGAAATAHAPTCCMQALKANPCDNKLQIGRDLTRGLGTGGKVGSMAAQDAAGKGGQGDARQTAQACQSGRLLEAYTAAAHRLHRLCIKSFPSQTSHHVTQVALTLVLTSMSPHPSCDSAGCVACLPACLLLLRLLLCSLRWARRPHLRVSRTSGQH